MKKSDIIAIVLISVFLSSMILLKMHGTDGRLLMDKSTGTHETAGTGDTDVLPSDEIIKKEIGTEKSGKVKEDKEENSTNKEIAVYISGCVKNPQVVNLKSGSRLQDAVDMCGGLLPEADANAVNLAVVLEDEEHYIVPAKGDINVGQNADGKAQSTGLAGESAGTKKININTADKTELMQLPNVGEKTAERIISYREKNGEFKTIDDIKNVSGIGDKKFDGFKDSIDVN